MSTEHMAADSVRVILAESNEHIDEVRTLLHEYWNSFGFTPCFQGFPEEVAKLPESYAPPQGRLGLAFVGDATAGCIALRRVDEERCEAKRLFVRPQSRGRGVGQALLKWLIAEARAKGYREMLGDTMPMMRQAHSARRLFCKTCIALCTPTRPPALLSRVTPDMPATHPPTTS